MTTPLKPQHDLDALQHLEAPKVAPTHFIDPSATLGAGVKVWHYAVVLADVVLGDGAMIGSGTEVGRGSRIGARSRIGSNVFLPSNTIIGEDVFLGPNVTCTDDRHPRVPKPGDPPYDARPPRIDDGAAVGAAAILLPGIHIGRNARVGAGAIVAHDVADEEMVRGEPARVYATPAEWGTPDGASE